MKALFSDPARVIKTLAELLVDWWIVTSRKIRQVSVHFECEPAYGWIFRGKN